MRHGKLNLSMSEEEEQAFVFIDTSALPRNPSRTPPEFDGLCELASQQKVKVYVSEIVEQEWVSQHVASFLKTLDASESDLGSILRHAWASDLVDYAGMETTRAWITANRHDVTQGVAEKCSGVLDRLDPTFIRISDDHAKSAFANYFNGHPPFSSAKARKDIPDAFIYEALKKCVSESGAAVYAVISDGRLREAAEQLDGVTTVNSIEALLKVEEIVMLRKQLHLAEKWKAWLEKNSELLKKYSEDLLDEVKSQAVDTLAGKNVEHHQIPEDNESAMIAMVNDPEDVGFDWDELQEFGVGLLSVPVSFKCSVLLNFSVFRGDAFSVPDQIYVSLGDFENDYYFDAEGHATVDVKAKISFSVMDDDIEAGVLEGLEDISLLDNVEISLVEDNLGSIFY